MYVCISMYVSIYWSKSETGVLVLILCVCMRWSIRRVSELRYRLHAKLFELGGEKLALCGCGCVIYRDTGDMCQWKWNDSVVFGNLGVYDITLSRSWAPLKKSPRAARTLDVSPLLIIILPFCSSSPYFPLSLLLLSTFSPPPPLFCLFLPTAYVSHATVPYFLRSSHALSCPIF